MNQVCLKLIVYWLVWWVTVDVGVGGRVVWCVSVCKSVWVGLNKGVYVSASVSRKY